MKNKKEKIFEKVFVVTLLSLLAIVTIEPAFAWGDVTHEAIVKDLNMPTYGSYFRGGAVGTDMFYFLSGKEYYSEMVHTTKTADFPREMLRLAKLANSNTKKAYSYGLLSHASSDIKGHTLYINPIAGTDDTLHNLIEIGVDTQIADKLGSLSFSVPYDLVQKGYKNTYGINPSYSDIYSASRNMMTAMYIEKYLIDKGAFDDLKEQVVGWEPAYDASVTYSREVINNPSILPNLNLVTGLSALSTSGMIDKRINIDQKIRKTADELIKNDVIKVHIKDDKQDKVLHVEDIEIKDKKKFEEEMDKLNK